MTLRALAAQPRATSAPDRDRPLAGLAAGTTVLTLKGPCPVERLRPGDRIITRAGARSLAALDAMHAAAAPGFRIVAGALGHDRPDRPLWLPADQPVLIRDWRAMALFGTPQAVVALSRLADGEFIAPEPRRNLTLWLPRFEQPQVIYAEGVELACATGHLHRA